MEIRYCPHCKRISFTYPKSSKLVCCGEEMLYLEPKTYEEGNEKHLPVVEKLGENKIRVKVGSVTHPMLETHWIQWIFIENGDRNQLKHFNPGEEPAAEFVVDLSKPVKVYEFCNLHGLWMTELK